MPKVKKIPNFLNSFLDLPQFSIYAANLDLILGLSKLVAQVGGALDFVWKLTLDCVVERWCHFEDTERNFKPFAKSKYRELGGVFELLGRGVGLVSLCMYRWGGSFDCY
ncbi:hypothetical protein Pfo_008167 [Paulownia fortunei]|nr:hypothetical protein Pfo_008167 [Paulownia fortunei]